MKNPDGGTSEWVRFSYPLDIPHLTMVMNDAARTGEALFNQKRFAESVEPLRKAMVFSRRLRPPDADRILELWNRALDEESRATMRFHIGDDVAIIAGEYSGSSGTVTSTVLRALRCYEVALGGEQRVFAADAELEAKR